MVAQSPSLIVSEGFFIFSKGGAVGKVQYKTIGKRRMAMFLAMMVWVGTMIFSFLLGTFLCYRVEKSGVKRWGATGRIFKYK